VYAYVFIVLLILAPILVPEWRTPLGFGIAIVAALGLAGLITLRSMEKARRHNEREARTTTVVYQGSDAHECRCGCGCLMPTHPEAAQCGACVRGDHDGGSDSDR
jgi:hypothetical protein